MRRGLLPEAGGERTATGGSRTGHGQGYRVWWDARCLALRYQACGLDSRSAIGPDRQRTGVRSPASTEPPSVPRVGPQVSHCDWGVCERGMAEVGECDWMHVAWHFGSRPEVQTLARSLAQPTSAQVSEVL